MNVYTAPEHIPPNAPRPWVFLAGSIEQDKAEPWQAEVIAAYQHLEGTLINPRRAQWDPTLTFEDPAFIEQVNWELHHLEASDIVMMYFDPKTQSPISLLELGLMIEKVPMYVSCTPEFWRYGNVKIVCDRNARRVFGSLQEVIAAAEPAIAAKHSQPYIPLK